MRERKASFPELATWLTLPKARLAKALYSTEEGIVSCECFPKIEISRKQWAKFSVPSTCWQWKGMHGQTDQQSSSLKPYTPQMGFLPFKDSKTRDNIRILALTQDTKALFLRNTSLVDTLPGCSSEYGEAQGLCIPQCGNTKCLKRRTYFFHWLDEYKVINSKLCI